MLIYKWGLLISLTFGLFACAGPQVARRPLVVSSAKPVVIVQPQQVTVIDIARSMLGVPYRYGGASPSGFDCSGLVSYAYRSIGISVPRTSGQQFRQATRVATNNLQPGDLLFFRLSPPKISHVAIYDRDGRFIHAPSSGKTVSYASLDNLYWRKHLVAAGRF